jgi:hypothetical protein
MEETRNACHVQNAKNAMYIPVYAFDRRELVVDLFTFSQKKTLGNPKMLNSHQIVITSPA